MISQEVTWVSEELEVISHHGGSFSLSTDQTLISLWSLCALARPSKLPRAQSSYLLYSWDEKEETSHQASILDGSAKGPPLCSSSLKCSLPVFSRWKRHRNDIRQCGCQWALSCGALKQKHTASVYMLVPMYSTGQKAPPATSLCS